MFVDMCWEEGCCWDMDLVFVVHTIPAVVVLVVVVVVMWVVLEIPPMETC